MPHAVFGIAARVSGGFCGAPCRAVPRAVVGGGGADPERRRSRRLAPGGDRGGPAVAPSSPGPRPCGRGPEPRPRPRSPPAIPAPFALSGRLAPRPSRARGCAPGMRAPAAARGTPRRRPPLRASPRVAAAPHCVPRARVVAVLGGCWFSAGVSVAGGVPRRPPGPVRGRGGSAGHVGRVWGEAGCVAWGEKGRRSGATAALGPPPRPRPLPPLAPPPRAARRGSPSGVVARRRVPRLGPCPTPRSSPPPSAFQPRQGSRLCRRPVLPPARPPFRRVRPACAHPAFPVPPPLPALSPPALSLSLSLPPSLAEGLEGKGGCWCVGGGGRR